MKIIDRAMSAARNVMNVQRRDGVYVSRPVTNGQEWYDWAVKWGVPEPLAADDLHVTIVHSAVDVKMSPDKTVKSIYLGPGYGDAASFALLGPKGESLCVCFSDWDLYNRHWNWVDNGAVVTWPTYRPHMTITNAVGDYELPDGALADAPIYINLGPEVFADLKTPDVAEEDPEGVEDGDGADLIVVIEVQMSAAQEILRSDAALSAIDKVALLDIASGRQITRGVASRIGAQSWAPDVLREMIAKPKEKPVTRTREVTFTIGQIPVEVQRALGAKVDGFKPREAERMAVGIANITTVGGELVVDAHDTSFTTQSMTEYARCLLRGTRASTFDHEGALCNEVVQAFNLSDDVQRALGIDLGFEPLLVEVHVPDDDNWAMVMSGDWMFSINGTFGYQEVEI